MVTEILLTYIIVYCLSSYPSPPATLNQFIIPKGANYNQKTLTTINLEFVVSHQNNHETINKTTNTLDQSGTPYAKHI